MQDMKQAGVCGGCLRAELCFARTHGGFFSMSGMYCLSKPNPS